MPNTLERILLASFLAATSAAGQDFAWRDRGDRLEGIASEPVSGGTFDLLTVQYVPAGKPKEKAERLHLFFWLPAAQDVEIEVRKPAGVNYVMVPKRKAFSSGRQEFSWPTAPVINPLGLRAAELKASVKNVARNLYYPALLWTDARPALQGRYVFYFKNDAALDWHATISREVDGRLTPVGTSDGSEEPGSFEVPWDGRDIHGKVLPGGVYVLKIEGTLDTETAKAITRTVYFQHHEFR